jgi:protoporphyrinogen oxidase
MNDTKKTAVIIGAGPGGLTAAHELLEKTDITPIIYEASGDIGGIARTINYKGNRMDIGGHRFFSKSDRIMEWWLKIMPIQGAPTKEDLLLEVSYQNKSRAVTLSKDGPDPEKTDNVMLVRSRLSRIFFRRKFFDYPISFNTKTFSNLGVVEIGLIGISYMKACVFPIKPEASLEDFLINRFGKRLYLTFFKDYTEKVWGVPCTAIKPEWGAQRIKGLSITKSVIHMITAPFKKSSIGQKNTETSLIQQFLYPKLGPGQMWEEVARQLEQKGVKILKHHEVEGITTEGDTVVSVSVKNTETGELSKIKADYVFSTMPIKELVAGMTPKPPQKIREIAEGLMYRDFITVGLLLHKLKIKNETSVKTLNNLVPDNWIYIQERDVKIGRLQIFNNWSPYLVKDPNTVWIGLEYFCNENDELWKMSDKEFIAFAIAELVKIDIIEQTEVLDSTMARVKKAYPAYFGSYDQFPELRAYLDDIKNLFLIGRNGMHRYNNQDHSMLTAIAAVESTLTGTTKKDALWDINTEQDYHEAKSN